MTKTEERRAAKLARREESKRRAEARRRRVADRDSKIRAENERHSRKMKQIWDEWRAA